MKWLTPALPLLFALIVTSCSKTHIYDLKKETLGKAETSAALSLSGTIAMETLYSLSEVERNSRSYEARLARVSGAKLTLDPTKTNKYSKDISPCVIV
jgi:hypothetical protein